MKEEKNEKKEEAKQEATSEKSESSADSKATGDEAKDGRPSSTEKVAAVAEATRKENDRREGILDREEALQKRKEDLAALGGESPAGTASDKKEKSNADYAKDVMSGETNA